MKNLDYYLSLPYNIVIRQDEEDGNKYIIAEIPELPGCGAIGVSYEQAINNVNEHKIAWLEANIDAGLPIPEPVSEDLYSGKFLLRIPVKIHMRLSKEAENEGLSLNQYIRKQLENHIDNRIILEGLHRLDNKIDLMKAEACKTSAKVMHLQNELLNVRRSLGNLHISQQYPQSIEGSQTPTNVISLQSKSPRNLSYYGPEILSAG